ncbi:RNHCP domain-containing protein [Streptomyces sp. N35]|uniref:RNHCP domain-containing protein n=1 Tax=Streptomyces sp. N35 TaxID=2795730 RepID=UPI0018F3E206|nr:RNHCP domain-containing protein [Streptomyces sp. N35]
MSSDHLAHQHHTTGAFGVDTFARVRGGLAVSAQAADGTRRHHSPSRLRPRHVLDQAEGGPSACGSRMSPIAIAVLRTGDWTLVHRCVRCGELTSNPVCGDDNQLILMRMAVRPLADPPFPLEAFGTL